MYISTYLKYNPSIPFLKYQLRRIKKHKKVKNMYLVCTSPTEGYLFEIMENVKQMRSYEEAYLVGLATSKEEAVAYVQTFVDGLYNTKEFTYEQLKTQ